MAEGGREGGIDGGRKGEIHSVVIGGSDGGGGRGGGSSLRSRYLKKFGGVSKIEDQFYILFVYQKTDKGTQDSHLAMIYKGIECLSCKLYVLESV